jgi:hypothetical protein
MNYEYRQVHFPNNNSWHRELVFLDGELIGEIRESTESTYKRKIYQVCEYAPLDVVDGTVEITVVTTSFGTVSDCKDYINSGGITPITLNN